MPRNNIPKFYFQAPPIFGWNEKFFFFWETLNPTELHPVNFFRKLDLLPLLSLCNNGNLYILLLLVSYIDGVDDVVDDVLGDGVDVLDDVLDDVLGDVVDDVLGDVVDDGVVSFFTIIIYILY